MELRNTGDCALHSYKYTFCEWDHVFPLRKSSTYKVEQKWGSLDLSLFENIKDDALSIVLTAGTRLSHVFRYLSI